MSTLISVKVSWDNLDKQSFLSNKYSREHIWEFDNGNRINAMDQYSTLRDTLLKIDRFTGGELSTLEVLSIDRSR